MDLAIQNPAPYSRLAYREKPDAAFFADFQRQFQADIANKTPLVNVLGEVNAIRAGKTVLSEIAGCAAIVMLNNVLRK